MATSRFWLLLAGVTGVAALGLLAFHLLLPLDYAVPFSVLTTLLFLFITIVLYFLGRRSAGARNKMLFGNVFLGLTMFKMLLCGMLVVGFALLFAPTNKLFVLPFFWLYIVYTSYEVYFLMKLSAVVPPAGPKQTSE